MPRVSGSTRPDCAMASLSRLMVVVILGKLGLVIGKRPFDGVDNEEEWSCRGMP
jgi:hypothetical protein